MAEPDLNALHQAYAKAALEKELSKYDPATVAGTDPLLANAQAATAAQNKAIADVPVSSDTQGLIRAAAPMPGDSTSIQSFAQEAAAQHQIEAQKAAKAALDAQTPAGQAKTMAEAATAGPPAPGQQVAPGAQNPNMLIAGPADAGLYANQIQNQSIAYNNQDAAAAKNLAVDTGKVDIEQNAAVQPHLDALAQRSDDSLKRMEALQQSVAEQQEKRMAHFQTVQNEMETMAKAQPKDLMGQAGVNSMLGAIAVFLGGAGTNGQHENRNLQLIQSMADRNVQAQKNRFEMLQRVGQGDQTLYGMLTQKLQNSTAVETALRNGYLSSFEAHLKKVGGQFADKRTGLQVQKGLLATEQLRHQGEMTVRHQFLQDGVSIVQLANSREAQMNQAAVAQHAAAIADAKYGLDVQKKLDEDEKYQKENGFQDLVGTVSPTEHKDLAQQWGGAVRIVDTLDKAQQLLKADPTMSNTRTWNALKSIDLGAAKKYFDTGQRLEGAEVAMMNGVGMSFAQFAEAMALGSKSGMTPSEIEQGYRNIQALVAQDAFNAVHAGAPHVQWGPPSTKMGRFNPEVYKFDFAGQAAKNHGPTEKRGLAKSLPMLNTDALTALEQTD